MVHIFAIYRIFYHNSYSNCQLLCFSDFIRETIFDLLLISAGVGISNFIFSKVADKISNSK